MNTSYTHMWVCVYIRMGECCVKEQDLMAVHHVSK